MKYLLIILVIAAGYSVFADNYIGTCDSIDPELLERYGFVERDGKYVSTYPVYDKYNRYCGEGTVILEPSLYWVSL